MLSVRGEGGEEVGEGETPLLSPEKSSVNPDLIYSAMKAITL